MRITIIGGGPSGLYFAILMKKLDPGNEISVYERDGPDDTFGWGIVFSDQTFSYLQDNDFETYKEIIGSCATWDNVDVALRGQRVTIRGNKFSGIGRLKFLNILHARCRSLGVELRFHDNVTDLDLLEPSDLVVGADGVNSTVRRLNAEFFKPSLDTRLNKYIWLGTHKLFDALTLTFRENEAGQFAAHSYKFNDTTSTFIVECGEDTWDRAGFAYKSDPETCRYLEEVFAEDLAGEEMLSNNFVRWFNFTLVKNTRWRHKNVVLLGDALHTAHFSIGSGTKLAVEDSIALATCFHKTEVVDEALAEFERLRKPVIEQYQNAAHASLLLFEEMKENMDMEPIPLAYKLMTRSKRIDYEKLKRRDPQFIEAYEGWREHHRV